MAYVISQGQLTQLSRPTINLRTSVQLTSDYTADYSAIWKAHSSVRTVTGFLGRNIASLGLHLFERVSNTDRRRNTEHPLHRLLSKPNPWTTRFDFIESLVMDLAIYDRFLALKVRSNDSAAPDSLVRIPPKMYVPEGENWMFPEAFEVRGTKGRKKYTPDQVLYMAGYSPDGDLGGSSPLESLRAVLAEEYEAARMRAQTFRNGARTSGYLERPVGAPEWSARGRERFRAGWRSQYTGDGAQAGGTPILEDGMKFVSASQSARDLQYIESRKLTREEVASAFYIPPPMIGLLERATFSNIKEQHKSLYQDTLGPWLKRLEQGLTLNLFKDFPDTDGLYLEFNIEEKLRGSFEEQAAQLSTATGGPFMTRNEARAMRNLPSVEGGDELITPLNVLTGGQTSPQDGVTEGRGGGTLAAPIGADDLQRLINAAGVLIRSGFTPEAALEAVGLEPIEHTGRAPVTIREPGEA